MKNVLPIGFAALTALFGWPSITTAQLVNGSFESLNFSGWTFSLGQGTSATQPFDRTAGAGRPVASWNEPSGTIPAITPESADCALQPYTRGPTQILSATTPTTFP